MAEAHKPGILAVAQKRLARTKTKVLQSLKKAERSTDESFDDLVLKTDKQHEVAHHLQKEIKAYVHCVRALSTACKSLTTALAQTYEAEWTDPAQFQELLTAQTLLWDNYVDNFQGSVIEPLSTYIASFPALKNKVAKRGRKMVDYDTARHNFEVLQEGKKKDEAKISKAQEDLNESKRIYEDLHAELCTELPDFYNSRVTFYADLFQKLYGCESQLHSELLKVSDSQTALAQKLSREYVEFVYTPKRPLSKSLSDKNLSPAPQSQKSSGDENGTVNGESSPGGKTNTAISSPSLAASPVKASPQPKSLARPPEGHGAVGGRKGHDEEEESDDEMYSNQDVIKAATKVNNTEQKMSQEEAPADLRIGSDFRHCAAAGGPGSNLDGGALSDSLSDDLEPDYVTVSDPPGPPLPAHPLTSTLSSHPAAPFNPVALHTLPRARPKHRAPISTRASLPDAQLLAAMCHLPDMIIKPPSFSSKVSSENWFRRVLQSTNSDDIIVGSSSVPSGIDFLLPSPPVDSVGSLNQSFLLTATGQSAQSVASLAPVRSQEINAARPVPAPTDFKLLYNVEQIPSEGKNIDDVNASVASSEIFDEQHKSSDQFIPLEQSKQSTEELPVIMSSHLQNSDHAGIRYNLSLPPTPYEGSTESLSRYLFPSLSLAATSAEVIRSAGSTSSLDSWRYKLPTTQSLLTTQPSVSGAPAPCSLGEASNASIKPIHLVLSVTPSFQSSLESLSHSSALPEPCNFKEPVNQVLENEPSKPLLVHLPSSNPTCSLQMLDNSHNNLPSCSLPTDAGSTSASGEVKVVRCRRMSVIEPPDPSKLEIPERYFQPPRSENIMEMWENKNETFQQPDQDVGQVKDNEAMAAQTQQARREQLNVQQPTSFIDHSAASHKSRKSKLKKSVMVDDAQQTETATPPVNRAKNCQASGSQEIFIDSSYQAEIELAIHACSENMPSPAEEAVHAVFIENSSVDNSYKGNAGQVFKTEIDTRELVSECSLMGVNQALVSTGKTHMEDATITSSEHVGEVTAAVQPQHSEDRQLASESASTVKVTKALTVESSEAFLTSSFSDVSASFQSQNQSPVGVMYEHMTFSSQEDLMPAPGVAACRQKSDWSVGNALATFEILQPGGENTDDRTENGTSGPGAADNKNASRVQSFITGNPQSDSVQNHQQRDKSLDEADVGLSRHSEKLKDILSKTAGSPQVVNMTTQTEDQGLPVNAQYTINQLSITDELYSDPCLEQNLYEDVMNNDHDVKQAATSQGTQTIVSCTSLKSVTHPVTYGTQCLQNKTSNFFTREKGGGFYASWNSYTLPTDRKRPTGYDDFDDTAGACRASCSSDLYASCSTSLESASSSAQQSPLSIGSYIAEKLRAKEGLGVEKKKSLSQKGLKMFRSVFHRNKQAVEANNNEEALVVSQNQSRLETSKSLHIDDKEKGDDSKKRKWSPEKSEPSPKNCRQKTACHNAASVDTPPRTALNDTRASKGGCKSYNHDSISRTPPSSRDPGSETLAGTSQASDDIQSRSMTQPSIIAKFQVSSDNVHKTNGSPRDTESSAAPACETEGHFAASSKDADYNLSNQQYTFLDCQYLPESQAVLDEDHLGLRTDHLAPDVDHHQSVPRGQVPSQALNPLAPPFTMPAPLLGPGSGFIPSTVPSYSSAGLTGLVPGVPQSMPSVMPGPYTNGITTAKTAISKPVTFVPFAPGAIMVESLPLHLPLASIQDSTLMRGIQDRGSTLMRTRFRHGVVGRRSYAQNSHGRSLNTFWKLPHAQQWPSEARQSFFRSSPCQPGFQGLSFGNSGDVIALPRRVLKMEHSEPVMEEEVEYCRPYVADINRLIEAGEGDMVRQIDDSKSVGLTAQKSLSDSAAKYMKPPTISIANSEAEIGSCMSTKSDSMARVSVGECSLDRAKEAWRTAWRTPIKGVVKEKDMEAQREVEVIETQSQGILPSQVTTSYLITAVQGPLADNSQVGIDNNLLQHLVPPSVITELLSDTGETSLAFGNCSLGGLRELIHEEDISRITTDPTNVAELINRERVEEDLLGCRSAVHMNLQAPSTVEQEDFVARRPPLYGSSMVGQEDMVARGPPLYEPSTIEQDGLVARRPSLYGPSTVKQVDMAARRLRPCLYCLPPCSACASSAQSQVKHIVSELASQVLFAMVDEAAPQPNVPAMPSSFTLIESDVQRKSCRVDSDTCVMSHKAAVTSLIPAHADHSGHTEEALYQLTAWGNKANSSEDVGSGRKHAFKSAETVETAELYLMADGSECLQESTINRCSSTHAECMDVGTVVTACGDAVWDAAILSREFQEFETRDQPFSGSIDRTEQISGIGDVNASEMLSLSNPNPCTFCLDSVDGYSQDTSNSIFAEASSSTGLNLSSADSAYQGLDDINLSLEDFFLEQESDRDQSALDFRVVGVASYDRAVGVASYDSTLSAQWDTGISSSTEGVYESASLYAPQNQLLLTVSSCDSGISTGELAEPSTSDLYVESVNVSSSPAIINMLSLSHPHLAGSVILGADNLVSGNNSSDVVAVTPASQPIYTFSETLEISTGDNSNNVIVVPHASQPMFAFSETLQISTGDNSNNKIVLPPASQPMYVFSETLEISTGNNGNNVTVVPPASQPMYAFSETFEISKSITQCFDGSSPGRETEEDWDAIDTVVGFASNTCLPELATAVIHQRVVGPAGNILELSQFHASQVSDLQSAKSCVLSTKQYSVAGFVSENCSATSCDTDDETVNSCMQDENSLGIFQRLGTNHDLQSGGDTPLIMDDADIPSEAIMPCDWALPVIMCQIPISIEIPEIKKKIENDYLQTFIDNVEPPRAPYNTAEVWLEAKSSWSDIGPKILPQPELDAAVEDVTDFIPYPKSSEMQDADVEVGMDLPLLGMTNIQEIGQVESCPSDRRLYHNQQETKEVSVKSSVRSGSQVFLSVCQYVDHIVELSLKLMRQTEGVPPPGPIPPLPFLSTSLISPPAASTEGSLTLVSQQPMTPKILAGHQGSQDIEIFSLTELEVEEKGLAFEQFAVSVISTQCDASPRGSAEVTFLVLAMLAKFTVVKVGDYLVDSRHKKEDKGLETNNVYEAPPGNADEDSDSDEGGLYQCPPSNQPVYKPPPNVLFIVEATHTYTGEDVDELCFEPGDLIYVVPYDDPEEQDEGWQMGIKQKDGMKGVFPENFTVRQN